MRSGEDACELLNAFYHRTDVMSLATCQQFIIDTIMLSTIAAQKS
jgi:hypothetical protein